MHYKSICVSLELLCLDVTLEYNTLGEIQAHCGSWIRLLGSTIRSCADNPHVRRVSERKNHRRPKRDDDDSHGKDLGLRLLVLASVIITARASPSQTNRHRVAKEEGTGRISRNSVVYVFASLLCVFDLLLLKAPYYRVQDAGSVLSFSAQPDLCTERSKCTTC